MWWRSKKNLESSIKRIFLEVIKPDLDIIENNFRDKFLELSDKMVSISNKIDSRNFIKEIDFNGLNEVKVLKDIATTQENILSLQESSNGKSEQSISNKLDKILEQLNEKDRLSNIPDNFNNILEKLEDLLENPENKEQLSEIKQALSQFPEIASIANKQQGIESKIESLNQKFKGLPTQIYEQVKLSLKENFDAQKNSIDQLISIKLGNNPKQEERNKLLTENKALFRDLLKQEIEPLKERLNTQGNQLTSLENQLKSIEAKFNQAINTQTDDDGDEDDELGKVKLSAYGERVKIDFNNQPVHKFTDEFYYSPDLRMTYGIKDIGESYRWSKELFLQKSDRGLFWSIRDEDENNYLLLPNVENIKNTIKTTFEHEIVHINRVFDSENEFDKARHNKIEIIYPAIADKIQNKDEEELKLKTKGKIIYKES